MTNKQKEDIVHYLEQAKLLEIDPEERNRIDDLIFAVKASSPYPRPSERVFRDDF